MSVATDPTGPAFQDSSAEAAPARDESAELLRLLSEATHDLVFAWDASTNRVLCNEAFRAVLGEVPADYPGIQAWWQQHGEPEELDRLRARYYEAFRTGESFFTHDCRVRDNAGTPFVLECRAYIQHASEAGTRAVLVTARDISQRQQAEEAQARLTRIIEATSDFVGMATADGLWLYINTSGRKLVGLGADEPLTIHIAQVHPEWANEIVLREALPTALHAGYWKGETALLHRDGHEIPVSQVVLAHAGADGKVEFISTIMRDLSDRKREEIARIEWANRYDAAIRASGQVLFDWNSFTNEIAYAGDIELLLGYSAPEMGGDLDGFRRLIHPEDLPGFDESVQHSIATRDPFQLEFRIRHKQTGFICIQAKGYFFLDRRGQIGRMVGFLADITAQKRAEKEIASAHESLEHRVAERTAELARASTVIEDRARQQEAVAHLGQRALAGGPLSSLFDEAMKVVKSILRVDRCSLLALTMDGRELITRAQAGWPEPDLDNRVPVGTASQSGYTLLTRAPVIVEDFATETRFTPSSMVARSGPISGVSVLVEGDDAPLGVIAAFSLSQRVFVQDDVHFLQTVANVLTAAIQRKRAEENAREAREEAEAASRTKSEFLSRMSHELRTPLNAILGFTQLLELDNPSPSQAESVQHISRAGKHLLALINEVLDIARIESGRLTLTPEPIDLRDFLSLALDLIRPLAQRHEITLIVEPSDATPPHRIMGDRQRLQQVMLNLLSNAVKYNRPMGRVTVGYRDDGPCIRISVTDTGSGIEPEKMARLFLPFERLGAESTDVGGTGIGLALSRGIVTALHGELNVESVVGEGSTFWVALPRTDGAPSVAVAAPSPAPSPEPPVAPSASHKVLYIEDQDLNLRLVERILASRPQYHLLTAMQGGLGLDLAREHQPDLVLLDLNLPDMTGDEVLRRLKTDPATRDIPVIMVSADAMGERVEELLNKGASGYLMKPYKLTEFLHVIEETLARESKKRLH
jgi:PAS domain S-box-containing protein